LLLFPEHPVDTANKLSNFTLKEISSETWTLTRSVRNTQQGPDDDPTLEARKMKSTQFGEALLKRATLHFFSIKR
jgi:hypothetical protein